MNSFLSCNDSVVIRNQHTQKKIDLQTPSDEKLDEISETDFSAESAIC
jgi:hypothetical protein